MGADPAVVLQVQARGGAVGGGAAGQVDGAAGRYGDGPQQPQAAQGDGSAVGEGVDEGGAGQHGAAADAVAGQRVPVVEGVAGPAGRVVGAGAGPRGGRCGRCGGPGCGGGQPVGLPLEGVGHQRDAAGRRAVGAQGGPVGRGEVVAVEPVAQPGVGGAGSVAVGGEAVGLFGELGEVGDGEGGPVGEVAAAALQGPGQGVERGCVLACGQAGDAVGEPGQGGGGGGRQRHGLRGVPRCGAGVAGAGGAGGRGCFFQDDVGVAAAESERADRRPAWPAGLRGPGHRVLRDGEGGVLEGDVRVEAGEAGGGGDEFVAQHLDGLDESGESRGAFEVADVGLGRADPQPASGSGGPPGHALRVVGEHLAHGVEFDRVAQRGAGAVRLEEAEVGGVEAGGAERAADQVALGLGAGGGQRGRPPAVVDGAGADDGQDRVAVGDGAAQ
ncbi:UNVERIFIED_CONTAM: hypothetical protein RKD43_007143 [Streptomyces graminofaciens]